MGVKLVKVKVKSYRSIANSDGMTLGLGTGMNAFVGPNNVGKSNVMRAVALAFGEDIDGFDLVRDMPANLRWGHPRITLEFRIDSPTPAEKTLLSRARELEREVGGGGSTYADFNRVILRVKYSAEGRQEYLVTKGAGDRRASERTNEKAIEQLHKCVRFVLVRSGESLDDFLRGRFSDVLGNVLRETQGSILEEARGQRQAYVDGLSDSLLSAIGKRVHEELAEVVPEISSVALVPDVPTVEETIRSARIVLCDAASTDLAAKGTGVRGGLLVAMLRYLAETSRRSLVFAVEEPESFLHPSAQEVIRDDLERLAERSDVTLLVSTHSPLVLSRAHAARHFALTKDPDGTTLVDVAVDGDTSHVGLISGLYRSTLLPQVLEEVAGAELPSPCLAVLVVEGRTDETYLRAAAARSGVPELVEDLHIVACGGAKQAVVQSVLWKSRGVSPVIVLLDHDKPGRDARDLLKQDFGFQGPTVCTYHKWKKVEDAEAEHLFPESLFQRFLKLHGDAALDGKRRSGSGWIYDIHRSHKEPFASFVEEQATPAEIEPFIEVLRHLREVAAR